jgi:hypothetical protein
MPDTSLAVPDGLRLSDWWESRDVPRSTAFRLLKVAGLEPEKVRAEGSRSPVSFLTADQVQVLDALAEGFLLTPRKARGRRFLSPGPTKATGQLCQQLQLAATSKVCQQLQLAAFSKAGLRSCWQISQHQLMLA